MAGLMTDRFLKVLYVIAVELAIIIFVVLISFLTRP